MTGFFSIFSYTFRYGFLFAGILIYAFCGSSTPDSPGFIELVVGLCLLCAPGSGSVGSLFQNARNKPFWQGAGQTFFFYVLSISLLIAALNGNSPMLMLRDIIPFLFFLLPMFLLPLLQKKPAVIKYMVAVIVAAGVIFSLRALYAVLPVKWFTPDSDELFYFANSPTVLFAALLLMGVAGRKILKGEKIIPGLMIALSIIPIGAMVLAAQRASLGAILVYVAALAILAVIYKPAKSWRVLALIIAMGIIFSPDIAEVGRTLLYKTREVGLNMRSQEATTIWQQVSSNPITLLFGQGWGAPFIRPP